jgi:hypothetical protein
MCKSFEATPSMKIENIDTEKGNEILVQLRKDGWKISDQYNRLAFDKGIDFDSYTLKKGDEKLYLEWSNWFEWEIQGSEREIGHIIAKFNLEST